MTCLTSALLKPRPNPWTSGEGMKNVSSRRSSWKELLANPGPTGHICQLYQDANFHGEAVSHFAAEGLIKGESVVIVATRPNWDHISRRLQSKGFDSDELFHQGQLVVLDAEATLVRFLVGNMPDAPQFRAFAQATIEQARAGGRFPRVRWWGEMVNLLYVADNQSGSTRLDELFDEIRCEESISIFHSFLMDKYDAGIYDCAFDDVCRTHTQVIPSDDYAMHRKMVDRAIGKVIGPIEGVLLESLVSWAHGRSDPMPSSQSALLWVRDVLPNKFDEVLACARKFESEALLAQLAPARSSRA